jgi:hypothetical protein
MPDRPKTKFQRYWRTAAGLVLVPFGIAISATILLLIAAPFMVLLLVVAPVSAILSTLELAWQRRIVRQADLRRRMADASGGLPTISWHSRPSHHRLRPTTAVPMKQRRPLCSDGTNGAAKITPAAVARPFGC